ncbi:DUF2235 domain-containing protein [Dyella mobilis]|uniref:DUF2235 domain-containing protein n=1 Tax=Dyella mobilis TaxID=1849582 RepID=A0ABS2KGC8_9GAMM|nr:DUF2235 domain-containing protein [Dyella mobilis]MBM7129973.1 DUF2235 domain-containing protein [Dyella mobilis]GLQ97764.1 hypothetical protein GCM10007863_21840 [Dyella mobilis]
MTNKHTEDAQASPDTVEARNLVVCCDGTSNEIGKQISNVLKLYRIAEKNEHQIVFYQPGIGTVAMPDSWGQWRQKARALFEMGTGYGLDRDVLNAYCFLASHYRKGDRIFLFGFSRGAYTVRVVAGMLYLIGLLREHQMNFAGYALKAYKGASTSDDYALARDFREIMRPEPVPIHFLGVWDTVASVVVPGRLPFSEMRLQKLPHTSNNPAVATFRHAMAIDEFRRMFRVEPWSDPQTFKPNRHAKATAESPQDIRQVWFAGCHSDVGGGFVEDESALSKYPLHWMLEQAADKGLRIRRAMVNHVVLGKKRKNAKLYTAPTPNGPLHRSLTLPWRLVEWLPKNVRFREWPGRRSLFGHYLPRGEPRFIGAGSLIHSSVEARLRENRSYTPSNLPESYETESTNGAPPSTGER